MMKFKSILRGVANPLRFIRQSKAERRHELVGPGGLWKMKREFQIMFLKNAGLLPEHYIADLGCGTLRGGIPLIDFLDKGHYFGIEARKEVLDEARKELTEAGLDCKAPSLILAKDISIIHINRKLDFIWSFSVLIHMSDEVLKDCFGFVGEHLRDTGVMYANVNIGEKDNEKWQGFPVVYRPLNFYINVGRDNDLVVRDIGSLRSYGHIAGDDSQDNQRMLKITRAVK